MIPTIWKDDPDPAATAVALADAQAAYGWDHTYLAPLPMLEIAASGTNPGLLEFLREEHTNLPKGERPNDGMAVDRLLATTPGVFTIEADDLKVWFEGIQVPDSYARFIKGLHTPTNLAHSPNLIDVWDTDYQFAWQRVAGPNCTVIRRLNDAAELQDKMEITDALLAEALGDGAPTVLHALQKGKLYYCDYGILSDPTPIPTGKEGDKQKILPVPIGLFLYDDAMKELRPVCVHLGQTPDAETVVRSNESRWQVAKTLLRVADFNHHEMITHLGLTHFLQEGFAVASNRALPANHPVMVLLWPHFRYLLFNNFAGRELLVNPGGFVDHILAGQLEDGSLELVKRGYDAFHFDDLHLPNFLKARGTFDADALPNYPYRDDGLMVWNAILAWVSNYVAVYYSGDDVVAEDPDLARWCRELTASDACHVKGFPEALTSRSQLADVLTRMIFLAGPHHAAVNFAQYANMMMVPNMPGAAYAGIDAEIMEVLPPMDPAHKQVEIIWGLTCFQYGTLGQYGSAITDERVHPYLVAFQAQLAQIEQQCIERDNTTRSRSAYPFLRPSHIPNSSNI